MKERLENEEISKNLGVFIERILDLENADFHKEIDQIFSDPLYERIAIALPRGHGKSTQASIAYPLWEIARNHNIRILLVSSTAPIAQSFMGHILKEVESNEDYQNWSQAIDPLGQGVIPGKRKIQKRIQNWSTESMVIERDDLNLKDPTVAAVGLFGSILSRRADIIVVDDVVNQKNSGTKKQREKIKNWIYTTLMPVLVPGGRFIYVGNSWHSHDLTSYLLGSPHFEFRKKLSAIISEPTNITLWKQWKDIYFDENIEFHQRREAAEIFYLQNEGAMTEGLKILWPQRFNYKDLYIKRLADPYSFERMYQCNPDPQIKDVV